MINSLALKVGLGGAVATTAGTVGIVYKDKIKDFFAQLSSKSSTYVIVKTTTTAADSSITKELYEEGKKNFKCQITKDETKMDDETCEIFEINAASSGKLNNLDDIQKSKTHATKTKITSDTFFKLTISDSLLSGMKWDGTQTIDIISKKEGNNDKKYGSFTLQYKVTDDLVVEGKTDLIIGKITKKDATADLSDSPTFKCLLTGETEKKVCTLFKIASAPTKIKDVELSGITNATKTHGDYAVGNWYVIDLKRTDDKKNISDLKKQNIVVIVNEATPEKPVATFEFQAALSKTTNDFSTSNLSKIIFA